MYNKGWCTMNNSVNLLVGVLEPLISDLDEKKKLLKEKKELLENVSKLLEYTKNNVDMLGSYDDQNIIIDNLEKINTDKDEYQASCYLLKSENNNIRSLPQYKKAYNLICDIVEYFKLYKSELIVETENLEDKCSKKEIEKKYCDILKEETPYIENVDEFKDLLTNQAIPNKDKIEILIYVINKNKLKYGM